MITVCAWRRRTGALEPVDLSCGSSVRDVGVVPSVSEAPTPPSGVERGSGLSKESGDGVRLSSVLGLVTLGKTFTLVKDVSAGSSPQVDFYTDPY